MCAENNTSLGYRSAFSIKYWAVKRGKNISVMISEVGEEMENRLVKETCLAASSILISSGLSCAFLLLSSLISTSPFEALGNWMQQLEK